jgi:hypothetical protein
MQTLDAMTFPFIEPSRHGDAMDLISLGDLLDRHPLGTQHQTMGSEPSSE